jgi:protein PhnA
MYLEESELNWANAGLFEAVTSVDSGAITKDSNGAQLQEGDSVTLIKDLDVKGAGFTAKRRTLVKNIRLTNNPEQIDARVNGIQIVLLTKFLKKV